MEWTTDRSEPRDVENSQTPAHRPALSLVLAPTNDDATAAHDPRYPAGWSAAGYLKVDLCQEPTGGPYPDPDWPGETVMYESAGSRIVYLDIAPDPYEHATVGGIYVGAKGQTFVPAGLGTADDFLARFAAAIIAEPEDAGADLLNQLPGLTDDQRAYLLASRFTR